MILLKKKCKELLKIMVQMLLLEYHLQDAQMKENYVFQKMIRATVGTNSVDCCARICHSPTAWGMQQTFGTGAATNSTEDIYHADLFLDCGADQPMHTH